MARTGKFSNQMPVARPSTSSLEGRSSMGLPKDSGKNKSVWQSFIDTTGFLKRHPNLKKKMG